MKTHYDIIQVGAHNGYTLNDRFIIERLKTNHNAIFIEPIKELFDNLVKNHNMYKPNNQYIFINKACSDHDGFIELYVPNVDFFSRETEPKYIELGLPQWTDQLVSVLPNHVKDHHINLGTKPVKVECVTLNTIVEEYNVGSIDILQIDTEGHDYEVMMGFDFEKIKPNMILFEYKHMDGTNTKVGEKYEKIMSYLTSIGYEKIYEEEGDTHLKLTK